MAPAALVQLCAPLVPPPADGVGGVATPEWCFEEDDGGFRTIDDDGLCRRLEEAYAAKGGRVEAKVGRWVYEFDLREMVQRNTHTGKERTLLRMGKESLVEVMR